MSTNLRHAPLGALPFALLAVAWTAPLTAAASAPVQDAPAAEIGTFELVFDATVFPEGFEGDVIVAITQPGRRGEPRQVMHEWFGAPPMLRFAVDVEAGAEPLILRQEDALASFPKDWADFDWNLPAPGATDATDSAAAPSPGQWNVQAVARRSTTGREAGLDAGDVHSAVAKAVHRPDATGALRLVLDTVVAAEPFEETERIKLFEMTSPLLSAFWGFEYTVRAGVLLPLNHDPEKVYPVVYSVTGFGGTADDIRGWERRAREGSVLADCIVVVPDASNRFGHSVFCNSFSIGPWGDMLVREMVPALEARFGGGDLRHRYVTGVSSGGWSSLWLQVAYPLQFQGCWSHVPDPIDFHDFQGIDLYEPIDEKTPRNMYVDENGQPRPLARRGDEIMLTYEEFVRREHVLNPGGQIRSFEGTFSQLDENGLPQRVFDVETGVIDHAVARTWRNFDISLRLLNDWDELEDVLTGKIRIYAGEMDNFYLEGAVERFKGLAEAAGLLEHMVVEVVPGMGHSLHGAGYQDMLATIARRVEEMPPAIPEPEKMPWEDD
ncbi:alpha/beta hydrolase-fold protein [Planctomycetes bacterium Pla163]